MKGYPMKDGSKYRILISGGPVHAYLDAVKIITNKFKGGLMAELAGDFAARFPVEVTYLTTKGSVLPPARDNVKVVLHDGFDDYAEKAVSLAKEHDAVILGAAVANLIPCTPWKGKFPSHDYKEGDVIPINFMIAPRIISRIKKAAPSVTLFGFKLLSGVEHDELIRAAYEVILDSGATSVIANDARALDQKYLVMKDRSVHLQGRQSLADGLWPMMMDAYYATVAEADVPVQEELLTEIKAFVSSFDKHKWFEPSPEGLVFGTVAQRMPDGSFVTTTRGKREMEDYLFVKKVDHETLKVHTCGTVKATLNAPLLDHIFSEMPNVFRILHVHKDLKSMADLPVLQYANPGTVRDSLRKLPGTSFVIEGHGAFILIDEKGKWL